jgi:type II restriction/modification system DNA methylase subunit YeeA
VPGGADLVTYWFEKARAAIGLGKTKHAGLVSTNSIRGGANRKVLERIKQSGDIYEAWDDEPWVVEGAAVRVSLVCFAGKEEAAALPHRLDGKEVLSIYSDLTAMNAANLDVDLGQAKRLKENAGIAVRGCEKWGKFEVEGDLARKWLAMPLNPHGKRNAEVLRPWINGMDITRRPSDQWIIDFGPDMSAGKAALYETPFKYILENVKQEREKNRENQTGSRWWLHRRSGDDLRVLMKKCRRYIVTPRVSKYRLFIWCPFPVIPDSATFAFARGDDTSFGVLHSRFHEIWALRLGTSLEDRPRYTPSTTFETFPFPQGLTPDIPAATYANDPMAQKIAAAAKRLNELRNNWLNPPDLVVRVAEVVEGYPDRILPKDEAAARVLKQRTLTNLYNERPTWLDNAHRDLDEAVAHAYGWKPDMSDDEMLTKLLALNLERAKEHPRR